METRLSEIILLEGSQRDSINSLVFVSCPEIEGFFNPCSRLHSSFKGIPQDICGSVSSQSDKVKVGDRIGWRKCFCQKPSMVGMNEKARIFIACATRRCKYFRWAESVLDPPYYHLAHSRTEWNPVSLSGSKQLPSDSNRLAQYIIQGSLGDCWFLSSVAVLCENQERLSRVLGQNQEGGYIFRFCLDGEWTEVSVDNKVPFFSSGKQAGKVCFAKPRDDVIFGSLIEKAYAQIYSSYAAISGGFITEAFFDLTGCPTESISLRHSDPDLLWAKLSSWKNSGFLIGCSTSVTVADEDSADSQGLVSLHAYSVIDVVELHNVRVGKQTKLTDFFVSGIPLTGDERLDKLRLVQIRNPWGKKEWTGAWSGKSDRWTRNIIEKLPWYSERDQRGTFWMEFSDWINMFSEVDVAKTHSDWWSLALKLEQKNHDWVIPLQCLLGNEASVNTYFTIKSAESNWCYITLVNPSLRGKSGFFFPDIHFIIRRPASPCDVIEGVIGRVDRLQTLETVLEADLEYQLTFFPISSDFILPIDWKPVMRIFSAKPLTVTPKKDPYYTIPVPAFEKLLCNSIPVKTQVSITPSCAVSVHSTSSLTVFSLTKTAIACSEALEIKVNIILEDSNLRSIGRWTYLDENSDRSAGTTILGMISKRMHGHFCAETELSGFSFEIEAIPSIFLDRPRKKTRPEVSHVIELE